MKKRKQFQPCRGELWRNYQRSRKTSGVLFFIVPDYIRVCLGLTDLLEISLYQELSVFSKCYYCGLNGGVCFLKCFQIELPIENRKLQRTQRGQTFSYVARTCSLRGRPSISRSSWHDFATLNQKALRTF